MSVEVRCPDCNSAWRVAESAHGEMLCPKCMTRIRLERLAAAGPAAARPPATAATPTTPARRLPAAAEPVGAAARVGIAEAPPQKPAAGPSGAYPPRLDPPVICPRCNLHFQPRQRPPAADGARKCVLVVDDLVYFRQIAKDALEPIFDVKTAATSAQARDILERGGIDLLVLDLTLDGCDAGRDLLAELVPKPCPILIFTARDESEMYGENWEQLKRLGADDLVIKGMKVAESLIRKVSGLLGVALREEVRLR